LAERNVTMKPLGDGEQTIRDFGEQWTKYTDNEGYYGSADYFADVWGPLAGGLRLAGSRVAEIGAGTGRFVNILLDAGVDRIIAIEPSAAMDVLQANTAARQNRIQYLRVTGDAIPPNGSIDYVFAIGVLHHIPDPLPVLRAARNALKPGGLFLAWLYGVENNRLYLASLGLLRAFATRVPHSVVVSMVWLLYGPLLAYITLARILPLPLHAYMTNVLGKLTGDKLRLVVYDQLKPAYAKYYRREEVEDLFAAAGYRDIRLYHRHGYSWAVQATSPGPASFAK
jgi:SAM-dependent methyltransferase